MTTTWQEFRKKRSYPALEEDISADVCVVGGGMTGVLLAYRLSHQGKKVVLLEKREIGSYATAMTTAFITKVIDSPLTDIIKSFNTSVAKTVWQSGQDAVEEFERIITKERIDCEFTRCPNFIYAQSEKEFESFKEEYALYRRLKVPAKLHEESSSLNFPNKGYLEVPGQAKFHSAKFLFALTERTARAGALIFENTEALSIKNGKEIKIHTKRGIVSVKDVIIATYKPIDNKVAHLKKVMYRSYVLEVQVPLGLFREGIYEDRDNPYHYFRIDPAAARGDYDRMIIGGEDHKDTPGKKSLADLGKESFKALGAYLARLMESHRYWIVKKWSGPILEPSDGLPLIGEVTSHRYVATGFSGNGMTYAMISSLIITDLIAGKKNVWAKAYDPKR